MATKQTLETEIKAKTSGTEDVKKLGQAIGDIGTHADGAAQGLGDLAAKSKSSESALSGLAKAAAGLFALNEIQEFASALTDVAVRYGKLEASLNTVEGSADAAASAFERIREFQAGAPIFSVEQVTEAYVQLKNLGLEPSERALRAYGNTAAATGKDIKQFVEAVADAATGEFERLKEFGIKAGVQGEQVVLQFQGGQTKIENSAKAISEALISIGETTFGKGIENQAKAIAGSIGEIEQAWTDLKLSLADTSGLKSAFSGLSGAIQGVRDSIVAQGDTAGKSSTQLQEMHDAIVRQISASEEWGARNFVAEQRLLAVNAALLKLQQTSAKTTGAQVQVSLPGISEDASKLIAQFERITASGKETAEALKEIGKGLKPGDVGSIRAYGQALEDLRLSGKATSAELRTAFEQTAKGLSAEGLRQFAANLEEAFSGQGLRDVQALNELLDVTLRESLQRFGLDAEQALSGIGKPVSDAIASLQTIQATLEATGASAEDTGRILSLAIEQAIQKADTVAELDALSASIEEMGRTGALSTTQLAEANAELAIQLREVEAQEARNNAVLQEAVRAQSEAVQAAQREATATERASQAKVEKARLAYEAAQAVGTESQQVQAHIALLQAEAEQADIVAAGKARIAEAAASKVAAITAEAEADGTLTEAEQAVIDKAEEVAAAKLAEAEASKTAATSKDIEVAAAQKEAATKKDNTEITNDNTTAVSKNTKAVEENISAAYVSQKQQKALNAIIAVGVGGWEEYNAILKVTEYAQAQLARSTELQTMLENAASSGYGLQEALNAAGGAAVDLDSKFNLLDQNQLSGLQSALDSVASKLESIRDSAKAALLEQQKEANTLAGNEDANQALEDEAKLADLKQQLQEAADAGDSQSVADLKEAIALLEQNIAARKQQAEEAAKTAESDQQSADATKESTDNVNARTDSETKTGSETGTGDTKDKTEENPKVTLIDDYYDTIIKKYEEGVNNLNDALNKVFVNSEGHARRAGQAIYEALNGGSRVFKETLDDLNGSDRVIAEALQKTLKAENKAIAAADSALNFELDKALRAKADAFIEKVKSLNVDSLNQIRELEKTYESTIADSKARLDESNKSIDEQIAALSEPAEKLLSEQDKIAQAQQDFAEANQSIAKGSLEEAQSLRDSILETAKALGEAGNKEEAIKLYNQAKTLNESIATKEQEDAKAEYELAVQNIRAELAEKITAAAEAYEAELKNEEKLHKKRMDNIAEENAARTSGASAGSGGSSGGGGGSSGGTAGGGGGGDNTSKGGNKGAERRTYADGGPVFSGHLPGYGGGDRRNIIAEDGEYVQRKEAVRHYGVPLMEAINRMQLPKFALGGPIGFPAQKMARGGTVSAPEMIIELRGPGSTASAGRFPRRSTTDELIAELGKSNAVRAGR